MTNQKSYQDFSWERIERGTFRAKVPNGWLVRYHATGRLFGAVFGKGASTSMEFIPDENHELKIK